MTTEKPEPQGAREWRRETFSLVNTQLQKPGDGNFTPEQVDVMLEKYATHVSEERDKDNVAIRHNLTEAQQEVDRLKATLAESTKMFCCYCGATNEKVEPGPGWNERMAHFLAGHLADCPTHPARKYVELLALVSDLLAHDGGEGSEDYDGRKFVDARRELMAARRDPNSPSKRNRITA